MNKPPKAPRPPTGGSPNAPPKRFLKDRPFRQSPFAQDLVDNLNRNVLADQTENAGVLSAEAFAAALFAEVKARRPDLSDETIREMIDSL